MSPSKADRPSAGFARPLAFAFLMIYGLLSFLTGYEDWQNKHRLAAWLAWALIFCGVLLGSASIRVLFRRRPAFGLSLFALLVLVILDLAAGLTPPGDGAWKLQAGRVALSALILLLVRRADGALP